MAIVGGGELLPDVLELPYFDYLFPYDLPEFHYASRQPVALPPVGNIVRPFTATVWAAVLASFFLLAVALAAFYVVYDRGLRPKVALVANAVSLSDLVLLAMTGFAAPHYNTAKWFGENALGRPFLVIKCEVLFSLLV